jgi:hypothetical protein
MPWWFQCVGLVKASWFRTGNPSDCEYIRSPTQTKEHVLTHYVLEVAGQELATATSKPPFLYDLGPEGARKVLNDIQAQPFPKLDVDVDEEWVTVPCSFGDVQVRIVRPRGVTGKLPAILHVRDVGRAVRAGLAELSRRAEAVGRSTLPRLRANAAMPGPTFTGF